MSSSEEPNRSIGQVASPMEASKGHTSPFQPLHDSTVGDSSRSQGSFALGKILPARCTLLQGSIWILNKERGGFSQHYNNTANCYVIYCHIIFAKGFSLSIGR